jgi:uncharacterized protein YbjT (DUF2867 family)
MSDNLLIFGGTGRTGLELAKLLAGRGDSVTAVVRPTSDATALEAIGVNVFSGTPLDRDDVNNAFASAQFDAVISTLGQRRGEPGPRADHAGIELIIDAAKNHGVQRMLMVTMIGAGDSISAVSEKVIEFLGVPIEAKTAAEALLANSGLDYTILRPGGLNSEPDAGTGIKTTDHSVMGVIAVGDLGRLVVECLDDNSTIGETYHTIDPEIKEQAPLQRGEDLPAKR